MEEDNNFGSGAEFPHELREDDGHHVTNLVKENPDTVDFGNCHASECLSEFDFTNGGSGEEVRGLDAIFALRGPLLFFTEAPQNEDEGENSGQQNCEPGAGGDFGQGG